MERDRSVTAERRSGPMRRNDFECRSANASRRRVRIVASALAVLMVACVAGWPLYAAHRKTALSEVEAPPQEVGAPNEEPPERPAPVEQPATVRILPERVIPGGFELAGQVCNAEGQALEHVTLLITRKTWPGGKYYQQAFTESTDEEGRFVLPEFLPTDNQYAVLVAAVKEGFSFQSVYQLMKQSPVEGLRPISLRLDKADSLTLIVRDSAGLPVANAEIIPSARTPTGGKVQHIYFQESEQVAKRTDDQGRVELNWFRAGDQAEVLLRHPDSDWQQRKFGVAAGATEIDLAAADALAQQAAPQVAMQAPKMTRAAPWWVIALCVGCAVAAACYFWLIIRVINRRERWAKRTVAALSIVAFVLAYPASIGPVAGLAARGYISTQKWEAFGEIYGKTVMPVLGFVTQRLPERSQGWVYYLTNNYVQIWLPEPSIQWPDPDRM